MAEILIGSRGARAQTRGETLLVAVERDRTASIRRHFACRLPCR
jgi:hypothetical protein